MPQYVLPDCEGLTDTLPVIVIHGTNDTVVPWLGLITQQGTGYLSILDTAYFWATHNQCMGFSGIEALDDVNPDDGTRVLVETFVDCADDSEVEIVGVYRGGHTYPGFRRGGTQGGLTTQDISASQVVWEFVSQFSR
jgi:polyhydroxybutyrate depolymerase